MTDVTRDEMVAAVQDIRAELRSALRRASVPEPDWDSAAGHLYRAERDCRRAATACVRQGVEDEEERGELS